MVAHTLIIADFSNHGRRSVSIDVAKCGLLTERTGGDDFYTTFLPYISKLTAASAFYVQEGYGTNEKAAEECSIFVKRQIPQIIPRNESCPFPGGDKICIRNSTNLRIDTGMVDSNDYLGINAEPRNRFSLRNVLTCAPLRTEEYTRVVRLMHLNAISLSEIQYLYGSRVSGSQQVDSFTFAYSTSPTLNLQDYAIA